MSGFLVNRDTSNPAGGIDPAQSPNVGQYGWTSADAAHVNQLIQYVNQCQILYDQTKASADYVDKIYQDIVSGAEIGVLSINNRSGVVTVSESSFDLINLKDYGAVGDGIADDTIPLQNALNSNAKILKISAGTYRISKVNITSPIKIIGDNCTIECGYTLLAGDNGFVVDSDNVFFSGINFVALTKVAIIRAIPTVPRSGLVVEDCTFKDGFYAVRTGLTADNSVRYSKILVKNCRSTAPVGQNASHFVSSCSDFITYIGNQTFGGRNAASYGAYKCTNIVITGNMCNGVEDTAPGADASIQIENSSIASISGNTCSHDLWIDDSSNTVFSGNVGRRLKVTVSEMGGIFTGNTYSNNICGRIDIGPYGTPPSGALMSCVFSNNIISSSGVLLNGNPISSSISIEGSICKEIKLINNTIVTSATTNSVSMNRRANFTLISRNNDFGENPPVIGGSGGFVYENNNKNPIYKQGNGYLQIIPASDKTNLSTYTWTPLEFTTESIDVNGEWNGTQFIPSSDGWYEFNGTLSVSPQNNSQIGMRLYRVSGSPAEVSRLLLQTVTGTSLTSLPAAASVSYLKAGDIIELQYYTDNANNIIRSGFSSRLSILKI